MSNRGLPVASAGSRQASNLLLNLAAAAGGAAARQGLNALGSGLQNWWQQPSGGARPRPRRRAAQLSVAPLLQALPAPPQRRRRRGRGRGRGPGAPSVGAVGAGRVVVTDSELIAVPAALIAAEMNPGADILPRLLAHSKIYERYRFIRVVVAYEPLSGMATSGSIAVTLSPGKKNAAIKDMATILKCQPCLARPSWKAGTLRAGARLDAQRWMHSEQADNDGISFTLYAIGSAANLGYLRVTYTVEFAFPHPF